MIRDLHYVKACITKRFLPMVYFKVIVNCDWTHILQYVMRRFPMLFWPTTLSSGIPSFLRLVE